MLDDSRTRPRLQSLMVLLSRGQVRPRITCKGSLGGMPLVHSPCGTSDLVGIFHVSRENKRTL